MNKKIIASGLTLLMILTFIPMLEAREPNLICEGGNCGGSNYIEPQEDIIVEEQPYVPQSSGSSKKKWDLDKYGSYTYFSRGERSFKCNEVMYQFDWHFLWARVLDMDGKQISSSKVHIFGTPTFQLDGCEISYTNNWRDVTLTKNE